MNVPAAIGSLKATVRAVTGTLRSSGVTGPTAVRVGATVSTAKEVVTGASPALPARSLIVVASTFRA